MTEGTSSTCVCVVQRRPLTLPVTPSWKFAIETETKTKIIIQVWIQGKNLKKQRLFIIVEENYWKSYTSKIKHKKPVEKLCFICFHPHTHMQNFILHARIAATRSDVCVRGVRVQHRTIDRLRRWQHRTRTTTITHFPPHLIWKFHQTHLTANDDKRKKK